MVLSSDHVSPATGLSPTVTLSKNGGAYAACAGAVSEIANGVYEVAGNATDTGTLGPLWLHATAATADPSDIDFQVVGFDPGLNFSGSAAAGVSGGLLLFGTGTGSINPTGGNVTMGANAAGNLTANLIQINGNNTVASGTTVTFPATVSSYAGGAVASVTAGVTVTTNNDKTGYSLIQTFPGNFSAMLIDAGGNTTAKLSGNQTFYVGGVTGNVTANLAGNQTVFIGGVTGNVTANLAGNQTAYVGGVTAPVSATITGNQTFNVTGTWTGNLTGSVGSVVANVTTGNVTLAANQNFNNTGNSTGFVGGVTGNVTTGNVTLVPGQTIEPTPIITGTCPSPGTSNTILFVIAASSGVTGTYVGQRVDITAGTGIGQSAIITAYSGSGHFATVGFAQGRTDWVTTPDATSVYAVYPQQVTLESGDAYAVVNNGTYGNAEILAAVEALSVGGNGSETVTITVTDSATPTPNPLQGAAVSLVLNNTSYTALPTNASGVTSISMLNATYVVNVALINYTFTPATLVVSGPTSQTYQMSGIAPPPPPGPNQTRVFAYLRDGGGNVLAGKTFQLQLSDSSTGKDIWNSGILLSSVSDSNGYAWINARTGSKIKIATTLSKGWSDPQTVADNSGGNGFEVSQVIGPF
jgi:hypothetical protein